MIYRDIESRWSDFFASEGMTVDARNSRRQLCAGAVLPIDVREQMGTLPSTVADTVLTRSTGVAQLQPVRLTVSLGTASAKLEGSYARKLPKI